MRWLRCSYLELQQLPDDYVEVAIDMAKREAIERRQAAREHTPRGRRR